MAIYQVVIVAVAAAGVLLTYWAGQRFSKARHLKDTVLSPKLFTQSQVNTIRRAVQQEGELPDDPALRAAAYTWAREETTYGPYAFGWMFWQFVGTALVVSIFYLIPGLVLDVIIAVVQELIVLLSWAGTRFAGRSLGPARALLAKYPDGPGEAAAD
jgi:hypothetical protein